MRIGEIAALAGVTSRAVRHYHRLGLLPEPRRLSNGYRDYGLRDALLLSRIRRLTELGLGLDEVRDALADDAGRDLTEILRELDADLARQEAALRERRERLAVLLAEGLTEDGPVSPALRELLGRLPAGDSPMMAKDREILVLLDNRHGSEELYGAMGAMGDVAQMTGLYERLDALADADTDDPRIEPLARELVDGLPESVWVGMAAAEGPPAGGFGASFLAEFPPAQAEVVRRVIAELSDRASRLADGLREGLGDAEPGQGDPARGQRYTERGQGELS